MAQSPLLFSSAAPWLQPVVVQSVALLLLIAGPISILRTATQSPSLAVLGCSLYDALSSRRFSGWQLNKNCSCRPPLSFLLPLHKQVRGGRLLEAPGPKSRSHIVNNPPVSLSLTHHPVEAHSSSSSNLGSVGLSFQALRTGGPLGFVLDWSIRRSPSFG